MMTQLFIKILNMSITAGWVVLAVMVLRIVLRKAPKWISCVLWSVVALRLMLPISVESIVSLVPNPEVIPQDIIRSETPAIHSGISVINSTVNPLFTGYLTPEGNLLEKVFSIASVIWTAGVGIMLLYSLFAYLRIRWQVLGSIRYDKNVYVCDNVDSPFILGTVMPKIYIPSGIEESQLSYVLTHEKSHIKRGDHWWKPLGFLLLTVYWFHPLLWAAYILLCRDIEMACDEKAIAGMDITGKRGYSEALIACSTHRKMVMVCPLAFGEVSVKSRIKSVLRYKKPAALMALAALVVCIVTAGCFLTDPLPCIHAYESEVVAEATCTSRGIEKHTCLQCQHVYTAYVDMSAHRYDHSVVTLAPTCTRQGRVQQTCTQCGATRTAKVALTPHTAGEPFFVQEANCTQAGKRSATCVDCAQVFVVEVLAANDVHDMKEKVLKAPTCTEPGEGINTCTRCGISENISYSALEHNYIMKVEHPITQVKVCTVCDHKEVISAPTHNVHYWIEWRDGFYLCAMCGETKTSPGHSSGSSLFDGVVGNTRPSTPELPSVRWDPYP